MEVYHIAYLAYACLGGGSTDRFIIKLNIHKIV